jgi:hypothetical protein
VKITDTSTDNLGKLGADRQIVLYKKGGAWYIKGAHQDMAKKLFAFLAKRVPERRANTGTHAVLTKKEFAKNPAMYDAYIIGQLAAIPSQSSLRLNRHAAATFDAMVQDAAADGVQLRVSNSFRDRKKAEKNAAKAGNSAAVAGYSSHSLGLAVDLLLHTAATQGEWTETSTRMDNLVDMYRAPAYKWLAEHAAAYGWYPFRNEPWHWEYNPEGFRETFFAELDATHRPGTDGREAAVTDAGAPRPTNGSAANRIDDSGVVTLRHHGRPSPGRGSRSGRGRRRRPTGGSADGADHAAGDRQQLGADRVMQRRGEPGSPGLRQPGAAERATGLLEQVLDGDAHGPARQVRERVRQLDQRNVLERPVPHRSGEGPVAAPPQRIPVRRPDEALGVPPEVGRHHRHDHCLPGRLEARDAVGQRHVPGQPGR